MKMKDFIEQILSDDFERERGRSEYESKMNHVYSCFYDFIEEPMDILCPDGWDYDNDLAEEIKRFIKGDKDER